MKQHLIQGNPFYIKAADSGLKKAKATLMLLLAHTMGVRDMF